MRNGKLILTSFLAGALITTLYSSCGELADEKDNDAGNSVTFGANTTCTPLSVAESFPEQYSQTCTITPECAEDVEITLEQGIDVTSVKVQKSDDKSDLEFTVKDDSSAIVIAKDNCPAEDTEYRVSYTGSGSPDDEPNDDGAGDDTTIDNAFLSCSTILSKSIPLLVDTTCEIKSACPADGYKMKLLKDYEVVGDKVEYLIPNAKAPPLELEYDKETHTVTIPFENCEVPGNSFVISYKADFPETPAKEGEGKLYAHPCGNGDPLPVSCDNAGGLVDMEDNSAPTCESLAKNAGDVCDLKTEQCLVTPMQACADTPDVKVSSAVYLFCREAPFPETTPCAVSERRHKENIQEIGESELVKIKEEILRLKLRQYTYKKAEHGEGAQLGFMIDEHPEAPFISEDGRKVNLYAYLSALVATVQMQQKEIDALRKEIREK